MPPRSAKALRQGSGLAGRAETGNEVGGVLGLTPERTDQEENYADRLLIGVPEEGIGAATDAAMVQPADGGIVTNGAVHTSLWFSKGYLLSHYYGTVLSSPAN
jgi:hypothetical protein